MFTASHNPAAYNGIKLCRSAARPVGLDSGLAEVRDAARALLDDRAWPDSGRVPSGIIGEADVLPDTPRTCARWSTCPGSGRCAWWSTRATGWPG